MKLTYDRRHNIAYLCFADAVREVEAIQVEEDLNVDLTPDGKVYGIELLNANEQLQMLAGGLVSIEDEETGRTAEVALP